MGRKARYTVEENLQSAERYHQGEASAKDIAREMGMTKNGRKQIMDWTATYRKNEAEE